MKVKVLTVFAVLLAVLLALCGCAAEASKDTFLYTDMGDGTCSFTLNTSAREERDFVEIPAEATVKDKTEKVTIVAENAMSSCPVLTKVILPEGIVRIDFFAFKDSPKLTEINFPSTLKEIRREAFRNTGLTKAELPEGLTSLGGYAFADCAELTEIALPASLTSVGIGAFSGCAKLARITFAGTEEQWKNVKIYGESDALNNVVFLGE